MAALLPAYGMRAVANQEKGAIMKKSLTESPPLATVLSNAKSGLFGLCLNAAKQMLAPIMEAGRRAGLQHAIAPFAGVCRR